MEKCESRFEVGGLGRGGISEAAQLGEQSWIFNAGVLGETALPRFIDKKFESAGGGEGGKVVR